MQQQAAEMTAAIDGAVAALSDCAHCNVGEDLPQRGIGAAGRQAVYGVLDDLVAVLFPGCHGEEPVPAARLPSVMRSRLARVADELQRQIANAIRYQSQVNQSREGDDCASRAATVTAHLIEALPRLKRLYERDLQAAYNGDPAARSLMEIVMSYPGFYTTIVHRIAHCLYIDQVPLIPRILSERAHARTGIDIHPGARIGSDFFIDHGTGVVIGETTVIGERVKIYQGVTLGALSFSRGADGHPIKGVKRHPNVEDDVTIYSGATILGGNTTIGAGSVIGANVWLTHSVPPGSTVYNQQPKPLIRNNRKTPDDGGARET